jgi:hypothetical protein
MTTRMPFGSYKGRTLEELPDPYLRWLAERPDLWAYLRAAVEIEFERRGLGSGPQPAPPRPIDTTAAEALIGAGLRSLAKVHHPDLGGDLATMQDLNAAADWLRGRVRELA